MNKNIVPTLQTKDLYVSLCFISWGFLCVFGLIVLYLLRPGLSQISPTLFLLVAFLVSFSLFGFLFLISLIAMTTYTAIPLSSSILKLACATIYRLLPYCVHIGIFLKYPKDRIAQSLIDLINTLSKRYITFIQPEEIMLLTPHCLQLDTCPIKVTRNAFLCKECGRCCVGGLVNLAKKYGTMLYIATGGTFARLLVKEHRPKVIIAIACERDLVLGMKDVFPVLVFGILNKRPQGPCFNTQVDLKKVEETIQQVLYSERSLNVR